MKEREIVSQNKDYFAYYPKRAGWLSQVSPCCKNGHWEVKYEDKFLMLTEIVYNKKTKACRPTGRTVLIDDNGIYDGDKK